MPSAGEQEAVRLPSEGLQEQLPRIERIERQPTGAYSGHPPGPNEADGGTGSNPTGYEVRNLPAAPVLAAEETDSRALAAVGWGLSQQPGLAGASTGRPPGAALWEQQSRSQGQVAQRNASTTARPSGNHFQVSLMPAAPFQALYGDGLGYASHSSAMQPPKSPLRGTERQNAGQVCRDAPGVLGPAKLAGRQLSSPGRRTDPTPAHNHLVQPAVRHPPRFLGGGSQQASTALRQPVAFGVHLMPGGPNVGKQLGSPAGWQAGLSQTGEAEMGIEKVQVGI